MALQGWRLFGVSMTIFLYIGGVIFLSINNVPNQRLRPTKMERFAVLSNLRNPKFLINARKIDWCTDLSLIYTFNNKPVTNATSAHYDGSYIKDKTGYLGNDITALASFPGSGNTWVRYLLQQSTGLLTGSIYKDYGLIKTGFPAENISNNSVIVVKTHEWGPIAMSKFTKAILLVRDPEKAIQAEFNRQSGGHIGFASPDIYKRTNGKHWQQFVTNKLRVWQEMNLSWGRNFTGSIKIVFFDDLVDKLDQTLRSMLEFLDYPVNEALLRCTMKRKEGIFRRRKRLLLFDPFTPSMRKQINEKRRVVYALLGRLN